jgi:plasmid maintenance system antidote protein VapI
MTESKAYQRLVDRVESYDTNAEAAEALGVSRTTLHKVINRQDHIGAKLAKRLGLQLVTVTKRIYLEAK